MQSTAGHVFVLYFVSCVCAVSVEWIDKSSHLSSQRTAAKMAKRQSNIHILHAIVSNVRMQEDEKR